MTDSPVKRLLTFGQSPWLDFISRGFLARGELGRLMERMGLRGVTSNPVIFEEAMAHSDEYADGIRTLVAEGRSATEIYETLAVEDVRSAADALSSVYRRTDGGDGFVSLEVSPHLADDAEATVAEARRLWSALDRPNVMIKVPATLAGLGAIRALLAEGINVNVTLLFTVERYRQVHEAFLEGMEAAVEAGRPVERIASVASFFLSRIDTLVDRELDRLADSAGGRRREEAAALRGETAIACARCAYGELQSMMASERFARLAARGARPQRLLWASTGTKDPAYSDVKYIEPLIGPHTVSTMPLATLEAYHDHGDPALRLIGSRAAGERVLERLADIGIDLDAAGAQLLREGLDKFAQPFDRLLEKLAAG